MAVNWRDTHAEINLANIEHNFKILRQLVAQDQPFFPMVKANAYGHGDIQVAAALENLGVDGVGVVSVEEGARLRESGVRCPILVFGNFDSVSAEAILKFDLMPVISAWHHIEAFERVFSEDGGGRIHLKFNTGMNRLGFEYGEAPQVLERLKKRNLFKVEGICSHLLAGENPIEFEKQVQKFTQVQKVFSNIKSHLYNSAAILARESLEVGARPGIALYGINPVSTKLAKVKLLPCMTIRSHVATIHRIKAGESVSYNATWIAKRDSVIAVVPIGYADGYPRALSNKGRALFRGCEVPIAGIVCMDYIMLDLTEAEAKESIQPFEEVVLLGRQGNLTITAEALGDWAGTIGYEIVTRISSRVPRNFVRN